MPAEELQCLYVVIKGQIEQSLDCEFVASYVGSNHADGLNNNDWFDSRRLPESLTKDNQLEPESTPIQPYQFRASEETLLLQVAGDAIDKISAQNHLVRQMLSDKLPERLKALRQRRHNKTLDPASYTNQQEVQQIMLQPVINVHLLPVHIVDANSSLYEAARIMTKAGLKHVLVRPIHSLEGLNDVNSSNDLDSSQTAQLETRLLLGILTDTDICRAVSDKQDPATTPCQRYANFNLRTIKASDEISDALLTMTRYRIHRLPVIDKSGDVVGVLGQSDMLAHIGHHSQLISIQIEQAQDLSLDTAVELIGRYIRAQHHNGVKIGNISRMVQTLNAQVFTKLWQLIVPDEVMANTCLIVMGSEGRGEQIMRTDQDNALIIRDGYTHPDLAQFADTFNSYLATLGYPLCDGNIMMTNPMWRQPLKPFTAQINLWFRNSDPMHGIYLSAILDAEYVCGDESLLTQVRQHLKLAHQQADPMFVRQFARAALQFGDVNQWWQKFVPLLGGKSASSDIDLKKAGIFPLVHGIRTLALENNVLDVPSTKRVRHWCRLMLLKNAPILCLKPSFFMAQRLSVAISTDDKHARQVDPTTLTALERDLLKECLAVVKSFKNQLRQHYQLEIA
ncbi:LOW QUALITY PROTEIN: predicted signal-transduction protein containing cAMP-binding and CBS domains [Psychrobacter sp. JCM 18901]|nr:LOW QUALITY PROTEIN: predicted signal-transduction protein containing cAMP-binding and CBS domains [Psychrobacter sp. JCM 18901]